MDLRLENFYESYFDDFVEKHSVNVEDFDDEERTNKYIREGVKFDFQNNFDVIDSQYQLIDADKDDEPQEYKRQLGYINNWINEL